MNRHLCRLPFILLPSAFNGAPLPRPLPRVLGRGRTPMGTPEALHRVEKPASSRNAMRYAHAAPERDFRATTPSCIRSPAQRVLKVSYVLTKPAVLAAAVGTPA